MKTSENRSKNQPSSESSVKVTFQAIMNKITVEPMLALYILASVLSGLAVQNVLLEKACRVNLNYTDEVCDALKQRVTANFTMEEVAVQKLVAWVQGWKTILQSFLPAMLIVQWGSWSDRHQRRK